MKTPTNVKEVQRLLGMINYVGKFVKNLSQLTEPLRKLLHKETAWHWEAEQEEAVKNIKIAMKSLPVLAYYNVNKPVKLSVDASSTAMGCCLMQNDKPIAYGTRALTKSQQNHPQIVKEAMAIRFGCNKFHEYIYGKDLSIDTDHKPLETIFKKPISDAPLRLQGILWDVLQYSPKVKYVKGTSIPIADTLSRDCIANETENDETYQINSIVSITDEACQRFKVSTQKNEELQLLKAVVKNGWPCEDKDLPEAVKKYATFKAEITCEDDLLFKRDRVIVPRAEIQKIMNDLHTGHSGINNTLARARNSTFWIGQTADIKNFVESCAICQRTQKTNTKEPALMKTVPQYPFQLVSSDLFKHQGDDYLLIADHYSGFFDFKKLKSSTSQEVIWLLKQWFAVHGIPETFESDGGPQYSSRKFSEFASKWNFEHRLSSPRYPRSNEFAERNVQTAKNLLKKCAMDGTDPYLALLLLRNTDRNETLKSQSQRLFSRATRSIIPTNRKNLHPKVIENVTEELTNLRMVQKKYFDKVSKKMEELQAGDKVRMQIGHRDWIGAKVIEKTQHPRSVVVETVNGNQYRRNNHHLHKTKADIKSPTVIWTNENQTSTESQSPENVNTEKSSDINQPIIDNEPTVSDASPAERIPIEPNVIKTRSGRTVKPVQKYDPSPQLKKKEGKRN